ncbi:MAG: selenide, water dikinase SelD [Gammaproteobacteria bacterium]|nr:selenide, water dikinase SelD [Gammaproteobacteria bacterium]
MQSANEPVLKDLVLVGGGHSHVAVLKRFGMKPIPGVRLTLITRDVDTPYSGMLPGYIGGHYTYDDCHIDLRTLARFAGARLYHAAATGLDLDGRLVHCRGRPSVPYDVLSIDVGSRPNTGHVPGAAEHAIPVKPIDRFLTRWAAFAVELAERPGPLRVVTVGAGAGGVELTLAVRHRLRSMVEARGGDPSRLTFTLVTDTAEILATHNRGVRARFTRVLAERGVEVLVGHPVVEVEEGVLRRANDERVRFDALFWVTSAAAPEWVGASGLATDADGFIRVDDCLQSVSHPGVFAAGDVAAMAHHPRPKSGVFAVRQGPPLTENLRRVLRGRRLRAFRPQKEFLSLITTGDGHAVASRGHWSAEGAWVWRWKRHIDRRWMRKYQELPEMETAEAGPEVDRRLAGPEALREISTVAMRCGGCGSKVGSTVLTRVLARLGTPAPRPDVLVGLNDPDDAAVVEVPQGKVMVHTMDYFRALIDDPYLFGRIAANHALGDVYAMGAQAQSALALATLPFGLEDKVEAQLYELLRGALEALEESGAALVGGHTSEGAELAFGLSVNGLVAREAMLRKDGMQPGDRLILTKPLGTGTLFAADMRGKARGRWIEAALAAMLQSNRAAAECLFAYGAHACTDVTGFGLLGHLVEMTRPSGVDARIALDALPALDGATQLLQAGITSTLQPENRRLRRAIRDPEAGAAHPAYPLLFDPQTAGGLLGSVPAGRAEDCVAQLRGRGYADAAVIGEVEAPGGPLEPITLVTSAHGSRARRPERASRPPLARA